jgi:hypothetical protein
MISRLLIAAALVVVLDQHGVPFRTCTPVHSNSTGPSSTGPAERESSDSSSRDRLSSQEFGRLVERLSEPNGYFDTDNLISDEASYLHVARKAAENAGNWRSIHRLDQIRTSPISLRFARESHS